MTNCEIDVHLWILNPDDRNGQPAFVCRNCGTESAATRVTDDVQIDYRDTAPARAILEACDDGFGEGGYMLNIAALTDPSAAPNAEAEAAWKFFLYPDDLRRLKAILAAVTI